MHDVYKQRLSKSGAPLQEAEKHDVQSTKKPNATDVAVPECGSCYGAEQEVGQCCNTCDEVIEPHSLCWDLTWLVPWEQLGGRGLWVWLSG